MSKIIEVSAWADKHATYQIVGRLTDDLCYLKVVTEKAKVRTQRAKSLRMVLEQYARWLGRYHALAGPLSVYERHITEEILTELDKEAFAWAGGHLAAVSKIAAGAYPWLSVPNFHRTRYNATTNLEHAIDALEIAILQLQSISARIEQRGVAA